MKLKTVPKGAVFNFMETIQTLCSEINGIY